MSSVRKESIRKFSAVSGAAVRLITPNNLNDYIMPYAPLHRAFKYLSFVHRADYLRTYFMHFHGGGYADVKRTTGSWLPAFEMLKQNASIWVVGYPERGPGDVAGGRKVRENWKRVVGNCAYICRPRTPFTTEWYNRMIALMDIKLAALQLHPARHPRDAAGRKSRYPIGWNQMLGSIFHPMCLKYSNHISQTLPRGVFHGYK